MLKRNVVLLMAVLFVMSIVGCAGVQSVKPYELGRVTAETVLFQARVAQNQGVLAADQFDKLRGIYDKYKAAQDVAINTRKAMISIGTAEAEQKATVAMNNLLILSTEFMALAQNLGLIKEGK